MIADIKDGLKYIYHDTILLHTVLSSAIVGTFALNASVLVPVFAKGILNQKEAGFGFLMSFMGVGSLIGAICIATLTKSGPKKFYLTVGPLLIAASLIFTGFTNTYVLTGLSLAITGLCVVTFNSNANSMMQIKAKDEFRGRATSVYSLFFNGFSPVGSLFTGFITDHFGPRVGFIANAIIIILLVISLNIYIRRSVSSGLKTGKNKQILTN